MLIKKNADIYTQSGYYGNILQAVMEKDYENIIQLSIKKVADIHAQREKYGNILLAEIEKSHENIV